jgi:hypothetical protein
LFGNDRGKALVADRVGIHTAFDVDSEKSREVPRLLTCLASTTHDHRFRRPPFFFVTLLGTATFFVVFFVFFLAGMCLGMLCSCGWNAAIVYRIQSESTEFMA